MSPGTQELDRVAFPRFSEEQLADIASCKVTKLETFRDGDVIVEAGERDFGFYVIRSGSVEVLDVSGSEPQTVRVHERGEFTGDIAHLTGRFSPVRLVARGDCQLHAITTESLRELLTVHPDMGDMILQAFIARRQLVRESGTFTGVRVIGSRYSQDTFRVREFLARNRVPHTWLDLEGDASVAALLEQFGVGVEDTPVVAWGTQLVLRNPSDRVIAESLGLRRPIQCAMYDLVVVGAGPAGLAAAVYGASEGLKTLVLERSAPGGQAGASMRIENYLGFPLGITGSELAERATIQASKFGAKLPVPAPVSALSFDQGYSVLTLEDGEHVQARSLIIATGADYRRLAIEGCARFEGRGVYYAATPNEAQICRGADVVVVGGGNSAGQAAVFLSGSARRVHLVVRGGDLGRNMSSYLVHRIEESDGIEIHLNTVIRQLEGDGQLGRVELVNSQTGDVLALECPAVFSFIGAVPRTDWLPDDVERDDRQFVRTGTAVAQSPRWTLARQPFLLETSHPGVFAAGDVRSGSVKRVASAVGEGAAAVQQVHHFLAGA